MWPGPRLTSVHSGVFSPDVVTPVWAGPAEPGLDTARGALCSLLSGHLATYTPSHTQGHKKKLKNMLPMKSGREKVSAVNQGELRHEIGPSVTEADSSHSIVRCPEPGQGSVSGPTHGPVAARVPGTGHRQSPAHVTHVTRSGLITDVTLVTTPALHPRVSTNSSLPGV